MIGLEENIVFFLQRRGMIGSDPWFIGVSFGSAKVFPYD